MADEQPQVIRQQMDETRASLTEKVEALENQVVGTVHDATAAVSETVDNVKQAVQDTVDSVRETVKSSVESVKEALDVTHQTQRHPWPMVGGAVVAGFVTGYFVFRRRRAYRPVWTERAAGMGVAAAPERPSWLDRIGHRFSREIGQIEDAAFASLSTIATEFVTRTLPQWIEGKMQDVSASSHTAPPHEGRQPPYREGSYT